MKHVYEPNERQKRTNSFATESVDIAVGFFFMEAHNAGHVALTRAQSLMNSISKALNRPKNERPFILIPIAHPALNTLAPNIKPKIVDNVIHYYE